MGNVMEKLNILVFNWRCWLNPDMGGAEVFTREVLKRWAEEGHAVTLFTSEFKDCKREEFVNGIRIVRHGGRFSVYGNAKKFYVREFAEEHYNVVSDGVNNR